jgi:hypothetical protein
MRAPAFSKLAICAGAFVALMALAIGAGLPPKLVVHMAFGGNVTAVEVPETQGSPAACPAPLKAQPATVLSAKPGSNFAFCVGGSGGGLDVQFLAPAAPPVDFDYPPTLSCVTLKPSDKRDLLVQVSVQIPGKDFPVECDIDRAFLYALSVERHGPAGLQFVRPNRSAPAWTATIEIPWSVLRLRTHESHLTIAVSPGGANKPTLVPLDVTIEDNNQSLSLAYSPFHHFASPAPSSKRPAPRLHDVEADVAYSFDQHTLLDAAFAQNGAAVAVQQAASQIIGGAPLPLPSAAALPVGPDNIITRTTPLVTFLRPSTALGDQDLRVFADSAPFSINKVGSLASGYTAGYSSSIVSGGAFYGLQRPGLYNTAYGLTVTIPTPEPRVTPSPPPTPVPTQTPIKLGVAPPPIATPGPIEESKTSHDPLATISYIDSVAGTGTSVDSVQGIALGTNYYKNTCASEVLYCALTFHVFGSGQFDAQQAPVALATPPPKKKGAIDYPDGAAHGPVLYSPPATGQTLFAGESGSYTKILSASGSTPSFVQLAEMFAAQQADQFYSPSAGSVTAFAPLSGPLGHLVFSYGAGSNEHVYSADLLALRYTSPYGDVFTDTSWQILVPFDTAGLRGWTLNAGFQSESLSDRVAELQQGLVTSYFSAIYPVPTQKAVDAPVPLGFVRPQTQQNAQLSTPILGKVLTFQGTGGFQNGFVTTCAPAPKLIACATSHDHAATWALFATRSPVGFGVANTASTAIPGDLAVATTSRYFGSYVNAPGSVTSFLSYNRCIGITAAYSNAAYPTGVPLAQKGETVTAKVYYPVSFFGIEGGYFRSTDLQNTTLSQSGYYALLHFGTTFKRPVPAPGCRG